MVETVRCPFRAPPSSDSVVVAHDPGKVEAKVQPQVWSGQKMDWTDELSEAFKLIKTRAAVMDELYVVRK